MSDHTGPQDASPAGRWVDDMLRAAYPASSGVTMAAVEALAGLESFGPAQVAYLMSVMYDVGAQVRQAAERAELEASRAARFEPRPAREARIALRMAQMAEQHEIAWLRRTGSPPPPQWPGGTPDEAAARYLWDADRPDHVPERTVSLRVRETSPGHYVWKDAA